MWTKDPAYLSVAAHLRFNGANGSTTFTDSSLYGITPVLTGDVSISTAQSKFGGSSARFNGGRLTLSHANAFERIAGVRRERTAQCWIRLDSVASSQTIFHLPATTGASNDVKLVCNASGTVTYNPGTSQTATGTQRIFANQWHHVAVVYGPRDGQYGGGYPSASGSCYVDGMLIGQFNGGNPDSAGGGSFIIGANSDGSNPMIGYMQEFHYSHRTIYAIGETAGVTYFAPPDDLLPTALGIDTAVEVETDLAFSRGAYPVSETVRSGGIASRLETHWHFGGNGKIVGTVKEKSLPTNLPLSRKVRLFREFDGIFVAEVWSDAAGNYTFDRIDQNFRYTIISYDYAQNYRAVVADNILPEARS